MGMGEAFVCVAFFVKTWKFMRSSFCDLVLVPIVINYSSSGSSSSSSSNSSNLNRRVNIQHH